MSVIEKVNIQCMHLINKEKVEWSEEGTTAGICIPQVFFANGEPWKSVNYYVLQLYQSFQWSSLKTVLSQINHLNAYSIWLKNNNIDWKQFPVTEKNRCIYIYRGFLIEQRNSGGLAASTVKHRINAVINFYKWLYENKLHTTKIWRDDSEEFNELDKPNFERTIETSLRKLYIPNRKRVGSCLEDGVVPITSKSRSILINELFNSGKIELYLMHKIAFYTGARSETIRTMQISSLENVIVDKNKNKNKNKNEIVYMRVGPPTKVKTKFDVQGFLIFPSILIKELLEYAYSIRRLTRRELTTDNNKTYLFLTSRGNPYSETSFTKEISDMRGFLIKRGHPEFSHFKFHQTRATYGSMLMQFALNAYPGTATAVGFVRNAMLHKHESTTWKYVKFLESESIKEKLADEFFNFFKNGLENAHENIGGVDYDNYS